MSGFHEKVLKFTAFRDVAHGFLVSKDGKDLLSRTWKDYANFRFGPESESKEVLQTGIHTVWVIRDSNPIRQALQYSLYLKPYHGDGSNDDDTRVWDVFTSFKFASSQVIIPFFTNIPKKRPRHTAKTSNNATDSENTSSNDLGNVWNTLPATNFEKVLYLVFLIRASQAEYYPLSACSLLGKRKRSCGIPRRKLSSQKLAFAIQRVTRAWDRVADSFGFGKAENMFSPYVIPSPVFDNFVVLSSRDEGYAPIDLERTFSDRMSSTISPKHVATHALEYTDDADRIFRQLAGCFIEDLRNVAKDSEFFETDAMQWTFGDIFPSSGPIKRFYDITGTLEAFQSAIGIEEELSFVMDECKDVFTPRELTENQFLQSRPSAKISGVCQDTCECIQARKRLESFMNPFFRYHLTSFECLIETDDSLRPLSEAGIKGKLQLILTDPPFNTRRESGKDYAEYDVLLDEEMKEAVNVFKELLRPGGHLFVFCSARQYEKWSHLLKYCKEDSDNDDEESEDLAFSVDKNPFLCIKKAGVNAESNFNKEKGVLSLKSVSDILIHARRLGNSVRNPMEMVRLKSFGHVSSTLPATTNVIDNVPRLEPGEAMWFTTEDGKGRKMLRAEQKSVRLLREIICRYTREGDGVGDPFGGTCSTGVACITVPHERMRRFVGCDLDESVYNPALKRVQNEFAALLLNEKYRREVLALKEVRSDILQDATIVHEHSGRPLKRINLWSPPQGLPLMNTLPDYIVRHVALMWQEIKRMPLIFRKPFHQWLYDLQVKMEVVDHQHLLAIECAKLGLYTAPSSIQHKNAGVGVFANRNFSKGDFIAPYYGRLIYHDMSNRSDLHRLYGQGFAACSTLEFLHYSIELGVSKESEFYPLLPKQNGTKHRDVSAVYIVPFKFTAASFINDPRFAIGDADKHEEENKRYPNVVFSQKIPAVVLTKCCQLCETDSTQIVATRTIKVGDELFVDYGKDHLINDILSEYL